MDPKTQDRVKALEVALNNEARERDFYLKHKERTSNAHGKRMFGTIADDESEHHQRILEVHKRLQQEGKWPETVPIKVKGSDIRNVIKKLADTVDTSSKSDMDDLKAVEIAIDFETKGEKFYRDLANSVENPVEKKFYEFLSGIEREHLLSLKDTHDYFKDAAGWYRIKEKLHVDGA